MNPGHLKERRIPSRERCYEILHEFEVPPHIIAHAEVVARVGLVVANGLKTQGEEIDLALVEAAGLLHDLTKHRSLVTGENHAQSAAKELEKLGYPRVAQVVAQHIFLRPGPPKSPIREEEIVYYADKRVRHTEIVSLKERFEDLRARYGKTVASMIRLYRLEDLTRLLERRLFKRLPFGPEDVRELVYET